MSGGHCFAFILPSQQGCPFSEVMLRQIWRTYLVLVKEAPGLILEPSPGLDSWNLLGAESFVSGAAICESCD